MKKFTQNRLYKLVTRGLLLSIVLIGITRFVFSFLVPESHWPMLSTSHKVELIYPGVSELWMRTDFFTAWNIQPTLISVEDKVFFLGSDSQDKKTSIMALDTATGEKIWSFDYPEGQAILLSSSVLFVGGVGEVLALNPDTGVKIWNTELPLSQSVRLMYPFDNQLYVDAVGGRYHVLDFQTGMIIETVDYGNADNTPHWRDFLLESTTEIESVDNILNRLDEQRISENIAKIGANFYVLTQTGTLYQIDPLTENKKSIASFVPGSLQKLNNDGNRYSYYVSANNNDNLLFIYLGDSGQLFALQLPD
jgi:hypothetical protein